MRQEKLLQPEEGCQLTCEGLDASVAKGFASLDRIQAGKEMLVRMVAMLTKLLLRFDPEQYRVHESAAGLATPFEYEYDDEDEDDLVALRRAYIWSPQLYANSGTAAPVQARGEQKRGSRCEAHNAASHAKAIVQATTGSLTMVVPV
jgi:hypothetical protein